MTSIKECLKFDLDNKECKRLFKTIKKFVKEFDKLAEMYNGESFATVCKVVATRPDTNLIEQAKTLGLGGRVVVSLYEYVCMAYDKLGDAHNTNKWCDATLKLDSENVEALLVVAAGMIDREEWEAAVRAYKRAHENDGGQRASEGYNRAQRLLKQAGEKNYYKVLGISRDSSKRQIKKV
jgi:DnaJ family protein C protein 3